MGCVTPKEDLMAQSQSLMHLEEFNPTSDY